MLITTCEYMPERERERKNKSFRLDEIILNALSNVARRQNTSLSRLVETILMDYCIERDLIPKDTEPLGETRGVSTKEKDE